MSTSTPLVEKCGRSSNLIKQVNKLVALRPMGRDHTSITNSALPVHEGFVVIADSEALDVLEKLNVEVVVEEDGRTERTGTSDVMIVVGAGC